MDAYAVANALDELADLLEVDGADAWGVRAHRKAASALRSLHEPLVDVIEAEGLRDIPGIGPAIKALILEAVETGDIGDLTVARQAVGIDVRALRRVPGLGPKKLLALRDELGVRDLADLEEALASGRLAKLKGIGPANERKIREALPLVREAMVTRRLDEAFILAARVRAILPRASLVGDARRFNPQVRELVLVGPDHVDDAVRALVQLGAHGIQATSDIVTATLDGLPVRLVTLDPTTAGRRVIELTGTDEHVKNLKSFGAGRGHPWKNIVGDEAAVYAAMNLQFVEPELRVGQEEVEQATVGALSRIVTMEHVRGDLQMHTTHSDGASSVREMAEAGAAMGYEYIGITDHVGALPIANAMGPDRIEAFVSDVAQANDADLGITVLAGAEVEVDREGDLTVPDHALEVLDYVAAGLHAGLDLAPERQTARFIRAIEHPLVRIVLHPTGRKVNERPGARLDFDAVLEAALEHNVALETNGSPRRMDLDAPLLRRVLGRDGLITTNTDAHSPAELHHMLFAVMTARRAWATPEQVINTWPLERLRGFLRPK